MSLDDAMVGPGRVRPLVSRWVVTAELVLETACHLGGEPTGATDMALLRDAREGLPLLPGTTLAGALRSHLLDTVAGFHAKEARQVEALFGGDRGHDEGSQSPLIVFDSLGTVPPGGAEIRDGVALDPQRGTADDHLKYDLELLPPGTTFPLRVELLVGTKEEEVALVAQLAAALDGLQGGAIALGARRSRGLGAFETLAWRARRFDLTDARGWMEWLTSSHEIPMEKKTPVALSPRDVLLAALKRAKLKPSPAALEDKRRSVKVEVELTFAGGLLVRSPATTPDSPDVVHLRSRGRAVLPGTSVAGALRLQARRIVRSVAGDNDQRVDALVDGLFGPRLAKASHAKPSASRLRAAESEVRAQASRTTRIRVDRFTQGVAAGALFEEEPVVGASVKLSLELRSEDAAHLGLLILLLKDIMTGDVPLGGSVAVGRGACVGGATLSVPTWPRAVKLDPRHALPQHELDLVNAAVAAFVTTARAQERTP